jgi:hypothetical protein
MQPPKFADVTVIFNDAQQDGSSESSSGSESNSEEASASPEPRQKHARQVKAMKVNVNKSVKDFKLQLSTIFGITPSQMRLFYVDHVMGEITGPEEIKFNQKKLYTYSVQDGDKFLVDLK